MLRDTSSINSGFRVTDQAVPLDIPAPWARQPAADIGTAPGNHPCALTAFGTKEYVPARPAPPPPKPRFRRFPVKPREQLRIDTVIREACRWLMRSQNLDEHVIPYAVEIDRATGRVKAFIHNVI